MHSMPSKGLYENWIIGYFSVSTAPETEFGQTEGRLPVKGYAKVEFRNGIVHEIDSTPLRL